MSKLVAAGLSSTVPPPSSGAIAWPRSTACSRVAGALDVRGPGGAEERLELVRGLADEHDRRRPSGHFPCQVGHVQVLAPAAGDEHDRRLERAQRGDDRVGLGALRVIDEGHAVERRDRLEAMLDAQEVRGRAPDGVRRDPEEQPNGDRRERIAQRYARPGIEQLAGRA